MTVVHLLDLFLLSCLRLFPLLPRISLFFVVILLGATSLVMAQSPTADWGEPQNVSRSGAASRPQVVVDSTGRIHLFWLDQFAGPFYSQGNGQNWSAPIPLSLPSGVGLPFLMADSSGRVHALWIEEDNQATLWYSHVPAGQLTTPDSWAAPLALLTDVVQVNGFSDSSGRLHLSLIRASSTAAGLYYLQSPDGGLSWNEAQNLAPSPYFRLAPAGHSQIRQLSANQLLLVWDTPQGQVWVMRSNGQNWEEPIIADQLQAGDSDAPRNIQAIVAGDTIHLTWQATHSSFNCREYHQWSSDNGASWRPAEPIFDYDDNCPGDSQLLSSNGNPYLLLADGQLMTWQNGVWSLPQIQYELSSLVDSQTAQNVALDCGRAVITVGEQLWVAACGQGIGQDIWWLGRSLDTLPVETPVWSTPAASNPNDSQLSEIALVADDNNRVYAFWSQAAGDDSAAIYLSYWDGNRWAQPAPVLTSPAGKTEQPAAIIDRQGHLLAVWSGGESGQIYFSQSELTSPTLWAEAVALPMPRPAGSSPTIGIDPAGAIVVVYAIPLNEGRGLYLTRSLDGGQSWSAASQIFDGVAAGWEMVDGPTLVQAGPGKWHLLWLERPLPFSLAENRLFYARSEDDGQSWSLPALVRTNSPTVGSVVRSWLVAVSERELHRAWQEWDGNRLVLNDQYSLDGGLNWQNASTYTTFSASNAAVELLGDPAGQFHLLLLGQSNGFGGELNLQHWLWQDERWQNQTSQPLTLAEWPAENGLGAAVTRNGQLQVVYTNGQQLFFTGRVLSQPAVLPTPLPPLTPTPTTTLLPSPMSTPQPTPTRPFPTSPNSGPNLNLSGVNGMVTGGVLALLPAGAVVLVVLAFYVRSGRSRPRPR